MRHMQRIISLILIVPLLFMFPHDRILAEDTRESEVVASGTINGTVKWNVTRFYAGAGYIEDTVINVSGTGRIPDYKGQSCDGTEYAPWFEAKDSYGTQAAWLVTGINIGEGITYIGKNAFNEINPSYINTIKEVVIPSTCTEIGAYAFYGQDHLERAVLPDSVQTIGRSAFSHKTAIVCSSKSAGFEYANDNGEWYPNPLILTDLKITLTLGSNGAKSARLLPGGTISYNVSTNIAGVVPDVRVNNPNMLSLDTAAKKVKAARDYTGQAGEYTVIASIYGQTASCTITLPAVYTISYYDGFYGDLLKTETYNAWQPFQLTYTPEKEGYKFAGWYKEAQRYVDEKGCFEITLAKVTELTEGDTDLFSAYKKLITGAKIKKISAQSYTGGKIKPTVTVMDGDVKLEKGKDYTVSFKNNQKVGKATVIVKGKGGYTGTLKKTFKIIPKKTTIKSLKNSAKKTATVQWKKAPVGNGYEIQYGTKKNFSSYKTKKVNSLKTTSAKLKSLKKGKTYYVRVRVYQKVGSKLYYSKWSSVKKVKIKK